MKKLLFIIIILIVIGFFTGCGDRKTVIVERDHHPVNHSNPRHR